MFLGLLLSSNPAIFQTSILSLAVLNYNTCLWLCKDLRVQFCVQCRSRRRNQKWMLTALMLSNDTSKVIKKPGYSKSYKTTRNKGRWMCTWRWKLSGQFKIEPPLFSGLCEPHANEWLPHSILQTCNDTVQSCQYAVLVLLLMYWHKCSKILSCHCCHMNLCQYISHTLQGWLLNGRAPGLRGQCLPHPLFIKRPFALFGVAV